MPRERSLDEFVDAGGAGSDGPGESADPDGSDGPADPAGAAASDAADDPDVPNAADGSDPTGTAGAPGDARPATPTYDWTPGGAACADCGREVEERWRGDAGPVCGDCKEW